MRLLTPSWNQAPVTADIFEEMDRVFATLAKGPAADTRGFNVAGEIIENEDHFLMSFDLPGMKKEDIQIEMKKNILTISGERKQETKTEGAKKVQLFERSYGTFKQSYALPTTVNEEKIEARYENGVLTLTLPKTPVAQPRKIEITSSNPH